MVYFFLFSLSFRGTSAVLLETAQEGADMLWKQQQVLWKRIQDSWYRCTGKRSLPRSAWVTRIHTFIFHFTVAAEICGGDDETSSGLYCRFDAESESRNTVVSCECAMREWILKVRFHSMMKITKCKTQFCSTDTAWWQVYKSQNSHKLFIEMDD